MAKACPLCGKKLTIGGAAEIFTCSNGHMFVILYAGKKLVPLFP